MHGNVNKDSPSTRREFPWVSMRTVVLVLLALIVWFLIYRKLGAFADWYTYKVMHYPRTPGERNVIMNGCCGATTLPESEISSSMRRGRAVFFLLFQLPHTFMLLAAVVFLMGIVRSFFTPERTRAVLAGKHPFVGQVLAALLGVVTPFCSCSAVPLFIGFVTAGVPLGATFTFLTAAPMVNEIAAALLLEAFGLKIMLLYVLTGLTIALVTGWIVSRCRMERYVEPWVFTASSKADVPGTPRLSSADRVRIGLAAVRDIVGKVWIYVVVGINIGAILHAFVAKEFLVDLLGDRHWWSVPLAIGIGVPIYSNPAGIIPIVQALLGKGVPLGTVLAFMMAVVGLSLPEFIILRKVLKLRLIGIFFCVVAFGILLVGVLFNLVLGRS